MTILSISPTDATHTVVSQDGALLTEYSLKEDRKQDKQR